MCEKLGGGEVWSCHSGKLLVGGGGVTDETGGENACKLMVGVGGGGGGGTEVCTVCVVGRGGR